MLELTRLSLGERGQFNVAYNVRHNVGRLRTTLEQPLELVVDTQTGKVSGAFHLTDLEVGSIDEAREKMAVWCDRMAAALRGAQRKVGELPLYERRPFKLDEQPLWLQEAYAQLLARKLAAQSEEDSEAIERWLESHPMVLVPGMLDAVEAEVIRQQEGLHEPQA